MGAHRDDTAPLKSLEEAILENIDQAATAAEVPARHAIQATSYLRRIVISTAIYGVILGVACTYALYKIQQGSDQNTEYLQKSCISANLQRALEKSLWENILTEDAKLSKAEGIPQSKAELAALKRIQDVINATYPQRDCTKVDEGVVQENKTGLKK